MGVLLTEGSSLTAREVVTCLGPLGYQLEVLHPDGYAWLASVGGSTLCIAALAPPRTLWAT